MATRLFFLPLLSRNWFGLEIALFLLVNRVCAIARKRTPNVLRSRLLDDCEGAITRDQYNIGDFVATDHL
jgi:hypothetical protein